MKKFKKIIFTVLTFVLTLLAMLILSACGGNGGSGGDGGNGNKKQKQATTEQLVTALSYDAFTNITLKQYEVEGEGDVLIQISKGQILLDGTALTYHNELDQETTESRYIFIKDGKENSYSLEEDGTYRQYRTDDPTSDTATSWLKAFFPTLENIQDVASRVTFDGEAYTVENYRTTTRIVSTRPIKFEDVKENAKFWLDENYHISKLMLWYEDKTIDEVKYYAIFSDYGTTNIDLPLYFDKNHTCAFENWTVTSEPTCTEDGVETGTCACTRKQTRAVPACHKMGEYQVTTAPTCTNKGVETRYCQREGCSHSEPRDVDALGHDYGNYQVTTAPTCTKTGVETRYCQRQGCSHSDPRTIDAKGHTPSESYVSDGTNHWKTCKTCKAKLAETEAEHTYGDDNICTVCEKLFTFKMTFMQATQTYCVLGLNEDLENVVIPATYRGYAVTRIGVEAFKDNKTMKTITIPASINSILKDAFASCSLTLSTYFLGTLNQWVNIDFYSCMSSPLAPVSTFKQYSKFDNSSYTYSIDGNTDTKLYIGGELVTKIEQSDNITNVNKFALTGYKYLTSLYLCAPNADVRYPYIDDCAFSACKNLSTVTLMGNGNDTIRPRAFYNCNIDSLVIDNYDSISKWVFSCDTMKTATLNVKYLYSESFTYVNNIETLTIGEKFENMKLSDKSGGQIFKYVKTVYINSKTFITNFATETSHTLPFRNFVLGYFSTNIDDKTSIYVKNCDYTEEFAKQALLTLSKKETEYSLYVKS